MHAYAGVVARHVTTAPRVSCTRGVRSGGLGCTCGMYGAGHQVVRVDRIDRRERGPGGSSERLLERGCSTAEASRNATVPFAHGDDGEPLESERQATGLTGSAHRLESLPVMGSSFREVTTALGGHPEQDGAVRHRVVVIRSGRVVESLGGKASRLRGVLSPPFDPGERTHGLGDAGWGPLVESISQRLRQAFDGRRRSRPGRRGTRRGR